MLGEKLKELREAKGLVQREIAAELGVDTAYVSKMESNEKPVSRIHLKKLAVMFGGITEEELLTLWLADKLYDSQERGSRIEGYGSGKRRIENKNEENSSLMSLNETEDCFV